MISLRRIGLLWCLYMMTACAPLTGSGGPAPETESLYRGRNAFLVAEQQGYRLVVERGGQGLILAFAAGADADQRYAVIFRSGVDTVRLVQPDLSSR